MLPHSGIELIILIPHQIFVKEADPVKDLSSETPEWHGVNLAHASCPNPKV